MSIRPLSPELKYAAINDTLKVVVRDLIVVMAQVSGMGRNLSDGLRQSTLQAVSQAQVNEQDHLSQIRQAMKAFHQEFFAEVDECMSAVEANRAR